MNNQMLSPTEYIRERKRRGDPCITQKAVSNDCGKRAGRSTTSSLKDDNSYHTSLKKEADEDYTYIKRPARLILNPIEEHDPYAS